VEALSLKKLIGNWPGRSSSTRTFKYSGAKKYSVRLATFWRHWRGAKENAHAMLAAAEEIESKQTRSVVRVTSQQVRQFLEVARNISLPSSDESALEIVLKNNAQIARGSTPLLWSGSFN
jgi:hypothetical protein